MLELRDLTAHYGKNEVISGASIVINPGEVVALIGANAAGKSTTMRVIAGLKKPTRGAILFDGQDIGTVPTLGLAPLIVDEISDTIAKLARSGLPILLAEQNAAMALGVADRAYVLASGRIAAEGTPASLRDTPVIQQLYFGATTSKTPA